MKEEKKEISLKLKGESAEEFLQLKKFTGSKTNTDAIKYLIRFYKANSTKWKWYGEGFMLNEQDEQYRQELIERDMYKKDQEVVSSMEVLV